MDLLTTIDQISTKLDRELTEDELLSIASQCMEDEKDIDISKAESFNNKINKSNKSDKSNNVYDDLFSDIRQYLVAEVKNTSREYAEYHGPTKSWDKTLRQKSLHRVPIDRVLDSTSIYRLRRMITPEATYKYMYLMLDSSNVPDSTPSVGFPSYSNVTIEGDPASVLDQDAAADELSRDSRYKWDFIPRPLFQAGTVNTIGNIGPLIGMRIFPVSIRATRLTTHRYLNTSDAFQNFATNYGSDPWTTGIYTEDYINVNNNFTVLIEEFSSQAYIGKDGRKFHFVLYPSLINPDQVPSNPFLGENFGSTTPSDPYYELLTSGKGNGWFWFRNPVTSFTTLTVTIASPFEIVHKSKIDRLIIPMELIYLDSSEYE